MKNRRRLIVTAAAALPVLRASSQGGAVNRTARIAFLSSAAPDAALQRIAVEPFRVALRECGRVEGLAVLADDAFYVHRTAIAERCRRARLPSAWGARNFITDGEGLASYQSDFRVVFARAGVLADRVLRGADPAEIPFEQSTKLELVINLKAAKAMGIVVPAALRLQADEVIE